MERGRNIFRFGAFTFDGDTRQLLNLGNEVHLSPKAFELLQILLTARPKALSKNELRPSAVTASSPTAVLSSAFLRLRYFANPIGVMSLKREVLRRGI